MRVRDIMTAHPYTLSADSSLGDALSMMKAHGIRHVPITDDGRVVGIISDRDIKMALGPDAQTLDIRQVDPRQSSGLVGWFMCEVVITVDADIPVGEACRLLVETKVGALPVVEQGRLIGIVSVLDVLRAAAPLFG